MTQFVKVLILSSFALLVLLDDMPVWCFSAIVLILVFGSSISQVIGFMAIFRFFAKVDPAFTHAYSNGQGLAGMITAGFRLFTVWLEKSSDAQINVPILSSTPESGEQSEIGVLVYFSVSALIVFFGTSLLYIVYFAYQKFPEAFRSSMEEEEMVNKSSGYPSRMEDKTANPPTAPLSTVYTTNRAILQQSLSISSSQSLPIKSSSGDGLLFMGNYPDVVSRRRVSGIVEASADDLGDIFVIDRSTSPLTFAFTTKSPFCPTLPEISSDSQEEKIDLSENRAQSPKSTAPRLDIRHGLANSYRVYKLIKGYINSVFIHFFLAIFLCPNFLYIIESSRLDGEPNLQQASFYASFLAQKDVFPVFMLFIFNIGDWIGRLLMSRIRIKTSGQLIIISVIHLVLLLPMFCMMNVRIINTHFPVPSFLGYDEIYLPLVLFYGAFCGFFSTNFVTFAPKSIKRKWYVTKLEDGQTEISPRYELDKRAASSLAIVFLSVGLFTGALSSLLLKLLLNRCFTIKAS